MAPVDSEFDIRLSRESLDKDLERRLESYRGYVGRVLRNAKRLYPSLELNWQEEKYVIFTKNTEKKIYGGGETNEIYLLPVLSVKGEEARDSCLIDPTSCLYDLKRNNEGLICLSLWCRGIEAGRYLGKTFPLSKEFKNLERIYTVPLGGQYVLMEGGTFLSPVSSISLNADRILNSLFGRTSTAPQTFFSLSEIRVVPSMRSVFSDPRRVEEFISQFDSFMKVLPW